MCGLIKTAVITQLTQARTPTGQENILRDDKNLSYSIGLGLSEYIQVTAETYLLRKQLPVPVGKQLNSRIAYSIQNLAVSGVVV